MGTQRILNLSAASLALVTLGLAGYGCKGSNPVNDALVGDWLAVAINRDGGAFQNCPTTVGSASCGASDILRLRSNGTYVAVDDDLYPDSGTWRRDGTQLVFRSNTGTEFRMSFVLAGNSLDLTIALGGSVYGERLRRL
ncbi:MAG: hypothetical protein ACK4XJ_07115 [Fimbriimonadaceae bacterium]